MLIVAATLVAIIGRTLGPGDLYQNSDQCKTAAFTADMVLHGRWLVPVDLTGAPTLKPPLVNYLAVPGVAASLAIGQPNELIFKLPLIFAALLGMVAVAWAGKLLFRSLESWEHADDVDRAIAAHAGPLGWVCAAAWLASPSTIKHLYFCRPDMLQNALLAWGWMAAVVLLTSPGRPPRWAAWALWLAAGLAALAKGPLALLLPAFLLLGMLMLRRPTQPVGESPTPRRWRTFGLIWGPILMLAIPAAWLIPAYLAQPDHIANTLLGGELSNRVSTGGSGLERLPMNAIRVPAFYFERFWPWAVVAVGGLVMIGPRRMLRHPLSPAVLWVLMVTALLIVVAGESGSFNAPAYPAIAVLGVYGLARMIAKKRAHKVPHAMVWIAAVALVVAGGVVAYEAFWSLSARTQLGPRLAEFARQASAIVGDDTVAFVDLGHNPVPLWMGRHPGTWDGRLDESHAAWVIRPVVEGREAVVVSDSLLRLKAGGRGVRSESDGIALYRGGLQSANEAGE